MRLKRAKTAPGSIRSVHCFSKVHFMLLHFYEGPVSVSVFDDWGGKKYLRTISGLIYKAKTLNSVQCTFFSERHRAPQAGRLAPLSSFPGSHTPHLSIKLPQPWTLSGSTCTSLVHIYFMYRPAECVLGYLLLGFMMLWLMKGFLGVLCFQRVGKPGLGTAGGICPFHSPDP